VYINTCAKPSFVKIRFDHLKMKLGIRESDNCPTDKEIEITGAHKVGKRFYSHSLSCEEEKTLSI
jgi:hypothetical protein